MPIHAQSSARALFVAGEAFSAANLQAQAKVGALMSLVVAPLKSYWLPPAHLSHASAW